ncbi:4a-hydroxytetrahydrobiopterin dehydratase [Streptomyces solincola]|uniref:Putative pterin-4-alpha-carbinolamine dehydratase n=1 Tax=Streptomyces solincola TaxID=2100817 RepID=A0A2S9PNQ0_9ACTN|nr:4a-hydroxytetrahydrobiopterin dehydratase [Streptomyces solincola]
MGTLAADEVRHRLETMPGWVSDGAGLSKVFRSESFDMSIDFVVAVAELCVEANHHPDLHVRDKRLVTVVFRTRRYGSVTAVDFDLARRVDALFHRMNAI